MNTYIVILFAFMAIMLIFGFWATTRNKETAEDYFVAGRSMNAYIVAGTYGASFLSAGSFLGTIGFNYAYGFAAGWQLIGTLTAMFVLATFFASKFWKFGYYNGGMTMPDLIGTRYPSKWSRGIYAVLILCIYTVGLAAMFMGFNTVLGMVSDIPYMGGIIVGAIVVLIYTMSGGARAVAWTDTVCAVLMLFAVVVTLYISLRNSGGFEHLCELFAQSTTPEGTNWIEGGALLTKTNSYLIFGVSFGWFMVWATGNLCQPHQITRMYLAKDEKTARKAVAICMIPFSLIYIGGLIIGAYGRTIAPDLVKYDTCFPYVVMASFPTIMAAVILMGIIAAIISTCSTMLLITSQCTSYDIYKKMINQNASEEKVIKISRVTMAVVILLAIFIAYEAQNIPGLIFLWSSAFAMMGAGILPSLIGAFYWKRANAPANISSMIVGFASTAMMYKWPELKPDWGAHPILPGMVLSFIVFIVVAFLTKPESKETIDKFFGKNMLPFSEREKMEENTGIKEI